MAGKRREPDRATTPPKKTPTPKRKTPAAKAAGRGTPEGADARMTQDEVREMVSSRIRPALERLAAVLKESNVDSGITEDTDIREDARPEPGHLDPAAVSINGVSRSLITFALDIGTSRLIPPGVFAGVFYFVAFPAEATIAIVATDLRCEHKRPEGNLYRIAALTREQLSQMSVEETRASIEDHLTRTVLKMRAGKYL